MADRDVTFVPHTADDTVDYKPLSLPAVLGLGLAMVYVIILLAHLVAALAKNEPMFLPGWTNALPIAAAILCAVGLWLIRGSEGTKAGTSLAKWGLGISAAFCLGYLTYQTFTGLAILQQANRFLTERADNAGFFPNLQGNETDVRRAFLFTLNLNERAARPEVAKEFESIDIPSQANPKGVFSQFLEHPLVRLLHRPTGGEAKIVVEPMAVHDWAYSEGAYHIARGYRISTEEGAFEVALGVSSIEPAAAGERRFWRVNWTSKIQVTPVSRTELGIKRAKLRQQAGEFLIDPKSGWFGSLMRPKKSFEVYLGTQPAGKREELRDRATAVAGTPLLGLAGIATAQVCLGPDQTYLSKLFSGFRSADKLSDYFGNKNLRVWDLKSETLSTIKAAIAEAMMPDRIHQLIIQVMPSDFVPWEVIDGEINLRYPALLTVPVTLEGGLRTDAAIQLELLMAAPADLDPDSPGAVQQWRVKSIELVRAWPLFK